MSNTDFNAGQNQSNGLAIAALVLGILSLILGIFTAIPGIIVGHIARSKIKRSPGQYGGGGMALAGLILSYAVLVLTLVSAYMILNNPELLNAIQQSMEQAQQQAK